MAKNRKAAEAVILKWIDEIDPSGSNTAMYKQFFGAMNDADFDKYMLALKERRDYIGLNIENLDGSHVTVDNNLVVGKKMGVEFFQRVWLTDPNTGQTYITPQKYLVVDMPVRRQIQTLESKRSVPEDNKHVDDLTDQPTGVSKGSSLSLPEILVLYSQGHQKSIQEFISVRGGNLKAMNAMDRSIHETGGAKLEQVAKLQTRARSPETLSILMKGMHLDNNF